MKQMAITFESPMILQTPLPSSAVEPDKRPIHQSNALNEIMGKTLALHARTF